MFSGRGLTTGRASPMRARAVLLALLGKAWLEFYGPPAQLMELRFTSKTESRTSWYIYKAKWPLLAHMFRILCILSNTKTSLNAFNANVQLRYGGNIVGHWLEDSKWVSVNCLLDHGSYWPSIRLAKGQHDSVVKWAFPGCDSLSRESLNFRYVMIRINTHIGRYI